MMRGSKLNTSKRAICADGCTFLLCRTIIRVGCSDWLGIRTFNLKNMKYIDISKLDKAAVLAALYNASRPFGTGFLHPASTDMTRDEAAEILREQADFYYLKGRAMNIDLTGDTLRTELYDRDNGEGAAAAAIAHLLPNVKDEPRPQLARSVRQHDS